MNESIQQEVGSRIRLYRKTSGITMEELAKMVHKSKASISKYESGQISVDINTLCDIAKALNVTSSQLLDYTPPQRKTFAATGGYPFGSAEQLYLYHCHQGTVYLSVLQLGHSEVLGEAEATLFYKANSLEDMDHCDCIYQGKMYCHSTVLSFILRNFHNAAENILLNFSIPMRKTLTLVGMICGLGVQTLEPTAHKILLSKHPMDIQSEHLKETLLIEADTFKEMKRKNILFIPIG